MVDLHVGDFHVLDLAIKFMLLAHVYDASFSYIFMKNVFYIFVLVIEHKYTNTYLQMCTCIYIISNYICIL